jgi:hypothetical protein
MKERLYRFGKIFQEFSYFILDETKVEHSTLLHIAAETGNTELVDFLLSLKIVDLLAKNFDGKTCAKVASTEYLKQKLQKLIEDLQKTYLRTNVYSGKVEKMGMVVVVMLMSCRNSR